jgi:hypothetical protein
MINQIDNYFWFKLNGFLRYSLIHTSGKFLPLYIVNEYPKSGGSWVGEMLGDALEVPFPRNKLPEFRSSIIHGHMMHSWNMHNVLIVWRDGRDVLISQYYHMLFNNDKGNSELVRKTRSQLEFHDYSDIKRNLPKFMEYIYTDKKNVRISWVDFFNKWHKCNKCIHTRYEDLRKDPVKEISKIIGKLNNEKEIDNHKIKKIVDKYSFVNMSGRDPGQENNASFMRKGIVGDWKNYFSLESRIQFNKYAEKAIYELGYEKDDKWIFSNEN